MQIYLVWLWLNGISCDCLICCREIHRDCGLTVGVILIMPCTCNLVSWRFLWLGLAMLALNSRCSALNLVLSQKCINSKINFKHRACKWWWDVSMWVSETVLLSAAGGSFRGAVHAATDWAEAPSITSLLVV